MGADSTIIVGTIKGENILEGKDLQEHFKDPSKKFYETSISVYNRRDSIWHQAWADNNGGFYEFVGEVHEGIRIFKTKVKDSRGAIYRMVFSKISKDSFIWSWRGIRDDWEEWKTVWEIKYKRID